MKLTDNSLINILSPDELTVLKLRALYENKGYARYHSGRFEEYRFYIENQSSLNGDKLITFNDLDGRLMALKPDVTLSIVKNAASNGGVKKLYYIENVYRPNSTGRNFEEISQMGLECIGKVSKVEASTVLKLAYESLKLSGIPFRLALSHVGYISGLMRSLGIQSQHRAAVYESIVSKNPHGLKSAAEKAQLSKSAAETLEKAALLSGSAPDVLKEAEKYCGNQEMKTAVSQMKQACEALGDENVLVDFSIRGDESYYSGLMFAGYLEGKSRMVLFGGQYDNVLKKMNQEGGAIGFAVYLDEYFGR
jgi:ATP phosphoribosyltransferase regulatory subunit